MKTFNGLITALFLAFFPIHAAAVDAERLEDLRRAAEAANSDAVVVYRDGELVAEWYFDKERGPIEAMSVVKSLVAVGIGRLVTLGKLELDQPVHTLFPEWKQGRKQHITVRHILTHTSGLQNEPNAGLEIYPAPDALQLALAAELSHDPGEHFAYNNKAVNLLSGIIERAYGERMDRFFERELFAQMGIDEAGWYYDRAGRPHAMAGIRLHARDLAKFGQLVLDRGTWNGERLVSEEFVDEMVAHVEGLPSSVAMLWWRRGEAWVGDGYLGQYLVVVPRTRTVAVRQIRQSEHYNRETDGFRDFVRMVIEL
jgi:CubicO group peptidase (beta-lactamase class C family)